MTELEFNTRLFKVRAALGHYYGLKTKMKYPNIDDDRLYNTMRGRAQNLDILEMMEDVAGIVSEKINLK
ncbi:MAG: hypothetical protein JWQ09_4414 [Segetibacter sp.]|nr:hypothetical protein [Segetibacter sp.]